MDVYTIKEAAHALGVSPNTVASAIREGRLPSKKRGGVYWIESRALETYRARTQPDGVARRGRPRKTPSIP